MTTPFVVTHAWRESRSSVRRLGIYMLAITLGVAALVAINSFRAGVVESVTAEAKRLLGADLALSGGAPFPPFVDTLLDSLAGEDVRVSRVTSTISVALSPGGATRLIQLRAVDGGYPFYTTYTTRPAGLWTTLADDRRALVEPSLLTALDVAIGDTLRIGQSAFRIAGVLTDLPADFSFRSAVGPRVFIAGRWLPETGLVQLGSMVGFRAYLAAAEPARLEAALEERRDTLRSASIRVETAQDQAEELAGALDALGRFLGLIGLAALLLGGLGVASAIGVFVREKRQVIAVLRCIGATQRTAFLAYLLQAALLGLAGAAAGALLGIGVQAALPPLLRGVFPIDTAFALRPVPILAGLAVGLAVATLFALLPLLEIRGIAPLQALRYDFDTAGPGSKIHIRAPEWAIRSPIRPAQTARESSDPSFGPEQTGPRPSKRRNVESGTWSGRAAAMLALAAGVAVLATVQAGDWRPGLAFTAGLAVALLALHVAARGLMRAARRWFPERASFVVRQGVAGLFRPRNQTAAVTVALGFGVFLVTSLWLVQRSLLGWLDVDDAAAQPNLVAFDIQADQRDGVAAILARYGAAGDLVPIVPARIARLGDSRVSELLRDPDSAGVPAWALRREYRNTYRAEMTDTEELIAGAWWDAPRAAGALPRVSVEAELAGDLDVAVGDRITWDLQGIEIETEVASLRRVDWDRIDTNFFVVFEPGAIDAAPQTYVTLARVEDAGARAAVQRDIARAHPNVVTLDVALVRQTLARIIDRVTVAIRFMAGVGVAAGLIVLAGALTASRFQRVRECALLRTLGATRAQVRGILLTEYLALGALAAVTGVALASVAAWALVTFFFDLDFTWPAGALALGTIAVALAAAALGMLGSGEALRGTPLSVLREGG